ncbi:MAG: hypothetical protein R3F31_13625 [Verrucomicrobiales bacterium]
MSREIVDRCLDLDPAKRPVDLREVRNDFRRMEAQFSLEDAEHPVSWSSVASNPPSCSPAGRSSYRPGRRSCHGGGFCLVRYLQESHVFRSRVDELRQVVLHAERSHCRHRAPLDADPGRPQNHPGGGGRFLPRTPAKAAVRSLFDKKELEKPHGTTTKKPLMKLLRRSRKPGPATVLAHIQLRLGDRAVAGDSFRKAIAAFEKLLADGALMN